MKTAELIARLGEAAGGAPARRTPAGAILASAALIGGVVAVGVLLAWLGMRPMDAASRDPAFWMKAAYTLAAALAGLFLVARLARPGGQAGWGWSLVVAAVAALGAKALAEVSQAPAGAMRPLMLGSTWTVCSGRIVALALPILALVLLGLRKQAPTRPRLAGVAAGLLAGGMAGAIYGLYCQETAAPFVLIWYSLGIAAVAALGALAGPRLLRW